MEQIFDTCPSFCVTWLRTWNGVTLIQFANAFAIAITFTRWRRRSEATAVPYGANLFLLYCLTGEWTCVKVVKVGSTTPVDGPSWRVSKNACEFTGSQLGPWTRAVNSGSGNRPLVYCVWRVVKYADAVVKTRLQTITKAHGEKVYGGIFNCLV